MGFGTLFEVSAPQLCKALQDKTSSTLSFEKSADSRAFQDMRGVSPRETNSLINDIVEKAEDVFLWVDLVVQTPLSTMIDNPSLTDLRKLLMEAPSDIMGL